MPNVQERVTDIEFHLAQLAQAQVKTERMVQELSRDMGEFKNEMAEFKNEMAEFKNEMAEFKNEMAEFKNEMAEFKNEMSDFKRESVADRKQMNKQWGDLANKLGTIIEDIVAPNVQRLARERFGCEPLERFFVRAIVRGPDRVAREFDVIVVGGGRVLLAETKSTITFLAIQEFSEKLRTFFDHFPEWHGRELIPLLASWSILEPAHRALTSARIYGLEMGEDTMRLVNDEEF